VERQEPIWRVTAKFLNEAGRVVPAWRADGVLPGGLPPGLRHHYERRRFRCLSAGGPLPASPNLPAQAATFRWTGRALLPVRAAWNGQVDLLSGPVPGRATQDSACPERLRERVHQQTAEQVVVINEIQMARSQYAGQSLVGVFLGAMHTQWTN